MVIKCKIKVVVNYSKSSISFNVQNDIKNISPVMVLILSLIERTLSYLEHSEPIPDKRIFEIIHCLIRKNF